VWTNRAGRAAVETSGHGARAWRGCCRRNPNDAERILWQRLTRDPPPSPDVQASDPGRAAHQDFVSSCKRIATSWSIRARARAIAATRAARCTWLGGSRGTGPRHGRRNVDRDLRSRASCGSNRAAGAAELVVVCRHCEERSDEAFHAVTSKLWIASYARNDGLEPSARRSCNPA